MKKLFRLGLILFLVIVIGGFLVTRIYSESYTEFNVYFLNEKLDPEMTCEKVFPIKISVIKTLEPEKIAVEELLKGPTESEKSEGYFTNINPGVKINSIENKDGTIYIDFNEELEKGVGGSCKVTSIEAQIRATLLQFSSVKEVVISIDGRVDDILQP